MQVKNPHKNAQLSREGQSVMLKFGFKKVKKNNPTLYEGTREAI